MSSRRRFATSSRPTVNCDLSGSLPVPPSSSACRGTDFRKNETHTAKRQRFPLSMSWDRTWQRHGTIDQKAKSQQTSGGRNNVRFFHVTNSCPKRTINMYDILIVGAGFAGSVVAERMARESRKESFSRRPPRHIAGNAYRSPRRKRHPGPPIRSPYLPHEFRAGIPISVPVHGLAILRTPRTGKRGWQAGSHADQSGYGKHTLRSEAHDRGRGRGVLRQPCGAAARHSNI